MKKEKKVTTTTNMIAETLKEDIHEGRLKPGDSIVEREIALKFEASHIPVREALRILEGEGYIIHRKFSGYSVREISIEEMVELYDIHRFLGHKLLNQAIPRYNELTYYTLSNILSEMAKTKDTKKIVTLFIRFIETAYTPSGLHYSIKLAMDIFKKSSSFFAEMIEKGPKGEFPLMFQQRFLELCQEKQKTKAIEWWQDEFDNITRKMVAIMSHIHYS